MMKIISAITAAVVMSGGALAINTATLDAISVARPLTLQDSP